MDFLYKWRIIINVHNLSRQLCYIMVDGKQYTFQEVDDLANQVGNYFYELGYRKGKKIYVRLNAKVFIYISHLFILFLILFKFGLCILN